MNTLLQPAGEVLVSFGPTWYHPLGGHLFSVFPWAHLIFSEKALIRWRSTFKTGWGDPIQRGGRGSEPNDYSEVRGVDGRQPPQVRQPRTCTHQEASTFSQPFHSRIYNSGGALPPGQTSMMANMRRARPPMTVPRRPPEAEEARRNGLARKLARRKRAGALLAPLQTLAASPPYRRALALQDFVESASGLIGKVHPAVAVAPVEVDAGDRLFQRFHAGTIRRQGAVCPSDRFGGAVRRSDLRDGHARVHPVYGTLVPSK